MMYYIAAKTMKKSIEEFKEHWRHYVLQSAYATIAIFILLIILNIEKEPIIIASIGASAFIVFAMPKDITARPRHIIGGHLTGLVSGSICGLFPHATYLSSAVISALAVGLSIFIMVVADIEHPPASGTALGFAVMGFSLEAGLTVIISVIVLSLIHYFFEHRLRDLL